LRKGHAARPQGEGRNQWDSDSMCPAPLVGGLVLTLIFFSFQ
jgi:hypothetical protein